MGLTRMMRLLLALTCITAEASLTTSGAQSAPGQPPELNFEAVFRSVLTLVTFSAEGRELSQGSGFLLASGRVVTNRHVVEGARIVEVKDNRGVLLASFGYAEAVSITSDVVILPAVSQHQGGLLLAASQPRVGERIFALGSPLGLSNTVSDGLVGAIRDDLGAQMLQITAPISPGSSGGPIINLRGEVVGVATSSIRAGQNVNFAVPANIVAALASSPVDRIPFPPRSAVSTTQAPLPVPIERPAKRPSLTESLPATPVGWVDEKEFRIHLMGCFADGILDTSVCVVDLEKKQNSQSKVTIGIESPRLTSPQGGEATATGAWVGTEQYIRFNPAVEYYVILGRLRTYLVFPTRWREGASYQVSLTVYGGESELRKFWSGRKVRSYTFNPQTIQFIDATQDLITKKIFGVS